ncbi:MAG: spermine/spermidine synthase domain-containing protein [Promethearchaeota archaeon]|jgi:spermidine synthase
MRYKTETILHSVKVRIEAEKILEDFYSEYSHIEIIKTKSFGKMLFLDNEIQLSELDEFIYHEMFCFPALLSHPNPKRVLIIGGGDLLLAKQVLKFPEVEIIDLVELDSYVIKFCRKHFKSLLQKTYNHPKLNIKILDGYKFMQETSNLYDLIFIDLPDKKKNCEFVYKNEFYKDVENILNPLGILSAQTGNGSCFYYSKRSRKIRKILSVENAKSSIEYFKLISRNFKNSLQYRQYIPSFFGPWSFTLGSKNIDFKSVNYEQVRNNYDKIKNNTLYYSPEYHQSLIYQPKIITKLISSSL